MTEPESLPSYKETPAAFSAQPLWTHLKPASQDPKIEIREIDIDRGD